MCRVRRESLCAQGSERERDVEDVATSTKEEEWCNKKRREIFFFCSTKTDQSLVDRTGPRPSVHENGHLTVSVTLRSGPFFYSVLDRMKTIKSVIPKTDMREIERREYRLPNYQYEREETIPFSS